MKFEKVSIEGLVVIKPKVFEDNRGHFFESFSKKEFTEKVGLEIDFVQDNQSLSDKGIIRGLHFQQPPFEQGKLIRVIKGAVLDVAVDIRKGSPTYGKYFSIELNEKNKTMLWIPPGFAHGFLTLENETIFSYKCSGYYNKDSEGGILWDDPAIGISWGISEPILSEKDKNAQQLKNYNSPFKFNSE